MDDTPGALAVVLERNHPHDVGQILLHGLRAELVGQHQHGRGLLSLDPLQVLATQHRTLERERDLSKLIKLREGFKNSSSVNYVVESSINF